jgi:hypothetical protein
LHTAAAGFLCLPFWTCAIVWLTRKAHQNFKDCLRERERYIFRVKTDGMRALMPYFSEGLYLNHDHLREYILIHVRRKGSEWVNTVSSRSIHHAVRIIDTAVCTFGRRTGPFVPSAMLPELLSALSSLERYTT